MRIVALVFSIFLTSCGFFPNSDARCHSSDSEMLFRDVYKEMFEDYVDSISSESDKKIDSGALFRQLKFSDFEYKKSGQMSFIPEWRGGGRCVVRIYYGDLPEFERFLRKEFDKRFSEIFENVIFSEHGFYTDVEFDSRHNSDGGDHEILIDFSKGLPSAMIMLHSFRGDSDTPRKNEYESRARDQYTDNSEGYFGVEVLRCGVNSGGVLGKFLCQDVELLKRYNNIVALINREISRSQHPEDFEYGYEMWIGEMAEVCWYGDGFSRACVAERMQRKEAELID